MNYYFILLPAFLFLPIHGMEETIAPKSWTPWESMPSIMDEYRAHASDTIFLENIPNVYEELWIGKLENPQVYCQEYFVEVNSAHISRLKAIIKKWGWPTQENFNKECSNGAWIIAQQANHDPNFQEISLEHLAKLPFPKNKTQHAYLSDRTSVNQGNHQFYGTCMDRNGSMWPIYGYNPNSNSEAETSLQLEMVNARRESVGLPSLQDELANISHINLLQKLYSSSQPTSTAQ